MPKGGDTWVRRLARVARGPRVQAVEERHARRPSCGILWSLTNQPPRTMLAPPEKSASDRSVSGTRAGRRPEQEGEMATRHASQTTMAHGSVAPGFEAVREEFARNFAQRGEL